MNIFRSRRSIPGYKLEAYKAKYPHLYFGVENGELVVYGGYPVPAWQEKQDRQLVREEYRRFLKDSIILPGPQLPKPEVVPVSSWPLPGAAATQTVAIQETNMERPTTSKVFISQLGKRRRTGGKPRRGKGKPTPRSRKFRIQNAALRPVRRPFKQVFDISLTNGYFDKRLKINELVPEILNVYEEVRITSMSIVFLVDDAAITAGLYTAILLDQDGYGTALKSTETWFKRVADMPGSVVHHATRGFRLTWRPTEPDSRNFIKVIDKTDITKAIARLYVIAKSGSLNFSGVLLVRGHCLCRGQYYDASKLTIDMMRNLRLQEIADEEREQNEDALDSGSSSDFQRL